MGNAEVIYIDHNMLTLDSEIATTTRIRPDGRVIALKTERVTSLSRRGDEDKMHRQTCRGTHVNHRDCWTGLVPIVQRRAGIEN